MIEKKGKTAAEQGSGAVSEYAGFMAGPMLDVSRRFPGASLGERVRMALVAHERVRGFGSCVAVVERMAELRSAAAPDGRAWVKARTLEMGRELDAFMLSFMKNEESFDLKSRFGRIAVLGSTTLLFLDRAEKDDDGVLYRFSCSEGSFGATSKRLSEVFALGATDVYCSVHAFLLKGLDDLARAMVPCRDAVGRLESFHIPVGTGAVPSGAEVAFIRVSGYVAEDGTDSLRMRFFAPDGRLVPGNDVSLQGLGKLDDGINDYFENLFVSICDGMGDLARMPDPEKPVPFTWFDGVKPVGVRVAGVDRSDGLAFVLAEPVSGKSMLTFSKDFRMEDYLSVRRLVSDLKTAVRKKMRPGSGREVSL